MLPVSYINLLDELLKLNGVEPFIIEIKSFNALATKLRANNINCRISYIDIEDYAFSIPDIAEVKAGYIKFMPNQRWSEYINRMSSLSLCPELTQIFKELWEK